MANPVKPQAKRSKPVPAIFADPAAEQAPFVSGTATFPPLPVATASVAATLAMVDHDAVAAAPVAAGPARTTGSDAAETDVTETLATAAADMVDAGHDLAERTVETVTARSENPVSALAKGSLTMATVYDTTQAKDMMGDISAKAKGSMEKGVKFAEDMTEFTKGNVEAIVTSGRVAAKGMEAMAQDAVETAKSGFEQVQTAMKSFTQVKSPTELFQLQSDYARTAFDQLVANAARTSEQMMKFVGEVAQPLSNRYALASEKVKSAAF